MSVTDRFELFVSSIEGVYKCVQRIKRQSMEEFGLRGTHVMCLYFLGRHPEGLTSAQLALSCGEDKAAISRSVAELEQKNLIACMEEEKKRYRAPLRLTEAGETVSRRMNEIITGVVRRADQGLAEEDRLALYRALEKIFSNLQTYLAEKEGATA